MEADTFVRTFHLSSPILGQDKMFINWFISPDNDGGDYGYFLVSFGNIIIALLGGISSRGLGFSSQGDSKFYNGINNYCYWKDSQNKALSLSNSND